MLQVDPGETEDETGADIPPHFDTCGPSIIIWKFSK